MKTAVITGGTRGIGAACVDVFKREGWNTIATGHTQDVRDPDMCRRIISHALQEHGQVDCLVNCAGILKLNALLTMSFEEWKEIIDVHLHGTFNMTKAALPALTADGGGSIVNMSSVAAVCGAIGQAHYAAAKGGVLALTRATAREFAAMKIPVRANAIMAGLIDTEMTHEHLATSQAKANMCTFVPMNHAGQPIDVAEMVYYLASDKANYITGAAFAIDGGLITGFNG